MKIRRISLEGPSPRLSWPWACSPSSRPCLWSERLRLELLASWAPLSLPTASRVVSLVAGVYLIVLASGLGQRRRQAWLVALACWR